MASDPVKLVEEMSELVVGAWMMRAPKKVVRAHLGDGQVQSTLKL